jgi:hypothetical protein
VSRHAPKNLQLPSSRPLARRQPSAVAGRLGTPGLRGRPSWERHPRNACHRPRSPRSAGRPRGAVWLPKGALRRGRMGDALIYCRLKILVTSSNESDRDRGHTRGAAPADLTSSFCQKAARVPLWSRFRRLTGHPGMRPIAAAEGMRGIPIIASPVTIRAQAWHSRLSPAIRTSDIELIIQWLRA